MSKTLPSVCSNPDGSHKIVSTTLSRQNTCFHVQTFSKKKLKQDSKAYLLAR